MSFKSSDIISYLIFHKALEKFSAIYEKISDNFRFFIKKLPQFFIAKNPGQY